MTRSSPVTVTIAGRLLRTPRVAVAALIVIAGTVFGGFTVRQAARMRAVPIPGVVLEGLTVVSSQHPSLRPGDRLIAVDRVRAYPQRLEGLVAEVPATGAVVPLTFQRGNQEISIAVDSAPLGDVHLIALWMRVVCALASFLVGVTSFLLMPGSRAAWVNLVFCSNIDLTLGYNVAFAADPEIFLRLEAFTFALGGSLGLHLFSELPERLPFFRRRPWAVALIYVPALPIVILSLTQPMAGKVWGPLALAAASWSILGGLICLGIQLAGRRRAEAEADEPLASRYRTMIFALLVGLFLPVLVHTVRAFTGLGPERWIIHLNAAPVVVYAAATGYALLRQNVMGADRVTTVVVSYGATIILLAAACGLALIAVPVLFGDRVVRSPSALVLVTAAASLSIVPVYRRLKRIIDRRFQRDRASDERITTELRDLMRLAMHGDPAKTMGAAFRALKVLSPERVVLFLRDAGGDAFHHRREEPRPAQLGESGSVASSSALGREMLAERIGGVEGLVPTALSPAAQAELWERGVALAAPVSVKGDVRAFVGLGRRSSGSRYLAGEQSFVAMVASQIGLALERGQEGTSIGKYRLDRRLGTGGMAEVYLARQTGMGGFERRVAIKRPLPHLGDDAGFIAMLLDEAKLAAQLHHPNIVETYEVDRQAGTYYIAMEYVDGASLRSLLRAARASGQAPPAAIALRIGSALLSALAHAHEAVDPRGKTLGIVHRDVTPGNVLVSKLGEVKLVDFGVARSATRLHVTQTGVVKGTLAYMAPEQAEGGEVDARSDLFGAAAVIFECLMGRAPYPDGPPKKPPEAPPAITVEIPATAVAVLHKALAFAPADRFASAAEMRQALVAGFLPVEPAPAEALGAWLKELLGLVPQEDPGFGEADTQTVRAP